MEIKNIRMTYLHLLEPHAATEGAAPKYSVCLLIPKKHPQIEEIQQEIEAAMVAKWGTKRPRILRDPLRDGDEMQGGEYVKAGPEFRGAYFMTASSPRKVDVIVGKERRAPTQDDLTWGNWGSVIVKFFGYDTAGNRGTGCGLNKVWITRRGEPLGGASEAWSDVEAEDFGAIAEQATAAGKQAGDIF